MFTFFVLLEAVVAAALVTVILIQRSEGGGLTTGGSPSGLMSARGAADFLTRSTWILASIFVALSIGLAVIAATRHAVTVGDKLKPATSRSLDLGSANSSADSLAGAAANAAAAGDNTAIPGTKPAGNDTVPLAK